MDPTVVAVLGPIWAVLGFGVVLYGVRARHSASALDRGCYAVSILWVLAGAAVNASILALGGSYTGFADGAYVDFVRRTWESVVVPHQVLFIGMLVAFEAVAGALALVPGRPRQLALVALIGFNVALLSFGWGFYVWSVPVGTGLALLLRAERRRTSGLASTTDGTADPRVADHRHWAPAHRATDRERDTTSGTRARP